VQELLDELLVIPGVTVLQPGGLSEQAIAMLAVQLLAAEPDPGFVTACRRATGGNPFLLRELFGEIHRRGSRRIARTPAWPASLARRASAGRCALV